MSTEMRLGEFKTALLEGNYSLADPSPYFVWKLKLTVEKRWREGRDLASSVHLQSQWEDTPRAHLKERNVTQHSHELQNGGHAVDNKHTHKKMGHLNTV